MSIWLSGHGNRLLRIALLLAAALTLGAVPNSYKYFVLNPATDGTELRVMSLADDIRISWGDARRSLGRYQIDVIQTGPVPGLEIAGTGPFVMADNGDRSSLSVPGWVAGKRFVIPHDIGTHTYFVLSPNGNAKIDIDLNGNRFTVRAEQGWVVEIDAGAQNGFSGRLFSDQKILLAHRVIGADGPGETYAVPPAAKNVWGIASGKTLIGALHDDTTVTAFDNVGNTTVYQLDAGGLVTAERPEMPRFALHVVADKPVAAVNVSAEGRSGVSAFLESRHLGVRHGLPVDARRLQVVCAYPDTEIVMHAAESVAIRHVCNAENDFPGHTVFDRDPIAAGTYLESSHPIYVSYLAADENVETGLVGQALIRPAPPRLDPGPGLAHIADYSVSGKAGKNARVRIYLNGHLQTSITAASDGRFESQVRIGPGHNVIAATVWNGRLESVPSNALDVFLTGAGRGSTRVSGVIGTDTTYTAGSSYEVTGDLTVATGVTLTIEQDVQLKFALDTRLIVDGTLLVQGSQANPVLFTSNELVPARADWDWIEITANAVNVVIDYAIVEYSDRGIYFPVGATGTVSNSFLHDNTMGVYVQELATPVVSPGNEITANDWGLYILANSLAPENPNPVVTGNSIYDNGYNFIAASFHDGIHTVLDATGNWWGSSDPLVFAPTIRDRNDTPSAPIIDYTGFLDGPGGNPVPGNFLGGAATADVTLTGGNTYVVMGPYLLPAGMQLIVEAGATVSFIPAGSLVIDGDLNVQGTAIAPAIFTSLDPVPGSNDWRAIEINNSSTGSSIDHALIEYAGSGVYCNACPSLDVTNSTLQNNEEGIYMWSATTALISGNLIQNNVYEGVIIYGSATPIITGNEIANNNFGVRLTGEYNPDGPMPIFSGNSLHDNSGNFGVYNYADPLNTVVDARGNWWGTTDPSAISLSIVDQTDNSNSPIVDYSDFLDGPGGTPVPGNFLIGQLATNTTLAINTEYIVLSHLIVPDGITLTVPEGVSVRVVEDTRIVVHGFIVIQGTEANPVLFTSNEALPYRSDWDGIWIYQSAPGIVVDHAIIEYAINALYFGPDSTGTVSNCILRESGAGIEVSYRATPIISNGNEIYSNSYGIEVRGLTSLDANPNPTVFRNSIYGNSNSDYYAVNFFDASNVVLDARENWWGTVDPFAISAQIYDQSDSPASPIVDYTNFLDGPDGNPITGEFLNGPFTATTTLTADTEYLVLGDLTVNAGVTLTIEEGVTLTFGNLMKLIVNGTLVVQGVAGNPVIFTSAQSAPAFSDWRGIEVLGSATGVVIDHAVIEYATWGVNVKSGASVTIDNSTIEHSLYGVQFEDSTGIVRNSTVRNNDTGIYVEVNADPFIGPGNEITANAIGIYVRGNRSEASNPNPVTRGNSIYGNTDWDYFATVFGAPETTVLDAEGNWWGTISFDDIEVQIFDSSDYHIDAPTVDYIEYLDGPGGNPVPVTDYLEGPFAADTTLPAGSTFDVLGQITVPGGVTLTIEEGVTLKFREGQRLTVRGTLDIAGTAANPVVLTSSMTAPAVDDWYGIVVEDTAVNVTIEHAVIEWGYRGLDVNGASITVRNSTIQNQSYDGIYIRDGTGGVIENNVIHLAARISGLESGIYLWASAPLINANTITGWADGIHARNNSDPVVSNNVIDNNLRGIYAYDSSPQITGNSVQGNQLGLHIFQRSYPTINGGNVITNNGYGITLEGQDFADWNPAPVINGNSIYDNIGFNLNTVEFYDGRSDIIDATGNWWGITDFGEIEDSIYDNYDSIWAPYVNWNGYLDAPGGNPVGGLYGLIVADTTLTGGTIYEVTGELDVVEGVTLTIEPGAILRFESGWRLDVTGTLLVQGTAEQPVLLTAAKLPAAAGDWEGIYVYDNGTVTIDHAVVQYANRGIYFVATGGLITNSVFQYNTIGVYMSLKAIPEIRDSAIINNTDYGVYLSGAANDAHSPEPIITANDIYGNGIAQMYIRNYASQTPIVVDVTGNWWGTPTPQSGVEIIFDNSPLNALDFSLPAAAALTGPTVSGLALSDAYFSPNADSIKDTTTLSGMLSVASDWTLTVRNGPGQTVRVFNGAGTAVSAIWDGADGAAQVQPDGNYTLTLAATAAGRTNVSTVLFTALDNTSPNADIEDALDNATVWLLVDVSGDANDLHFTQYQVDYGEGANPAVWTGITAPLTTQVQGGTLLQWDTASIAFPGVPNGTYTIRLLVDDEAGNQSEDRVVVDVDNLNLSNIGQDLTRFDASGGGQVTVNYDLNQAATVTLSLYPELDGTGGTPVWQGSLEHATGGSFAIAWDGTDNGGNLVVSDAYVFVVNATDGTRTAQFVPADPTPSSEIAYGAIVTTEFNTFENEFWSMQVDVPEAGRAKLTLNAGFPIIYPYGEGLPVEAGLQDIVWDGRVPDTGEIYVGTVTASLLLSPFANNYVIVDSDVAVISGPQLTGPDAPYLEVKADPYVVFLSYGQITRIVYHLDRQAQVAIKLLPPGIVDFDDPGAILVNDELQAPGDHQVMWTGEVSGGTGKDRLLGEDGVFSFVIQASGVGGITSEYRGVINAYR